MIHACIDLETTGLNSNIHEICSITVAVVEDFKADNKRTFTSLIQPVRWASISDEAMKVNGITLEELRRAPTRMQVLSNLNSWWDGVLQAEVMIPQGFNYNGFDKTFLVAFLGKDRYDNMFHYQSRDVSKELFGLVDAGLFEDRKGEKLTDWCHYFNIDHLAHNSLGDVIATIELREKVNKILRRAR